MSSIETEKGMTDTIFGDISSSNCEEGSWSDATSTDSCDPDWEPDGDTSSSDSTLSEKECISENEAIHFIVKCFEDCKNGCVVIHHEATKHEFSDHMDTVSRVLADIFRGHSTDPLVAKACQHIDNVHSLVLCACVGTNDLPLPFIQRTTMRALQIDTCCCDFDEALTDIIKHSKSLRAFFVDGSNNTLVEALKTNTTLQVLHFGRIYPSDFLDLCSILRENQALEGFAVEEHTDWFSTRTTDYSVECAEFLESIKYHQKLKMISLGHWHPNFNPLLTVHIKDLLSYNSHLVALNLHYCFLGPEGIKCLVEGLNCNSVLQVLHLNYNEVKDDGCTLLAESLRRNSSLLILNLSDNKIGAEGAKHLADALKVNFSLSTLLLANNRMGDEGALCFANALCNNTALHVLDLQRNCINNGSAHLGNCLKTNNALLALSVYNSCGGPWKADFGEALTTNESLIFLNTKGCTINAEDVPEKFKVLPGEFDDALVRLDSGGILAQAFKTAHGVNFEFGGLYQVLSFQVDGVICKNGDPEGCALLRWDECRLIQKSLRDAIPPISLGPLADEIIQSVSVPPRPLVFLGQSPEPVLTQLQSLDSAQQTIKNLLKNESQTAGSLTGILQERNQLRVSSEDLLKSHIAAISDATLTAQQNLANLQQNTSAVQCVLSFVSTSTVDLKSKEELVHQTISCSQQLKETVHDLEKCTQEVGELRKQLALAEAQQQAQHSLVQSTLEKTASLFTAWNSLCVDEADAVAQNLMALGSRFERHLHSLQQMDEHENELGLLKERLADLKKVRLQTGKQLITRKADVEMMELIGESGREIAAGKEQVKSLKFEMVQIDAEIGEVQDRIRKIAQTSLPEAVLSLQTPSPNPVHALGVVVKRSLSEFTFLQKLWATPTHTVHLASHMVNNNLPKSQLNVVVLTPCFPFFAQNRQIVLKEFFISNSSALQVFKNEAKILAKLHHPGIVRLECVFFHEDSAFIQLPYFSKGNLRSWIGTSDAPIIRPPWEIQTMFHKILDALCFLHSNRITHRDLKFENVLLSDSGSPLLCDFGISKEKHFTVTSTTMLGMGTEGYIAPEVQLGAKHSTASDLYAIGVMLHEAFYGKKPSPISSPSSPASPLDTEFKELLSSLISSLLSHDPSLRPTASEALLHPFFSHSFVSELQLSGCILDHVQKISLLRQFFSACRKPGVISLDVRRDHIVEDVCVNFQAMTEDELLQRTSVRFIGEDGIDAGGLTAEMYTAFFASLFKDNSIFECVEDRNGTEPVFLPSSKNENLPLFETIGKVFLKSMLESHPFSASLAPSVFKHLLGKMPANFSDLGAYDPCLATQLRGLLAASDVHNLGVVFPDDEHKELNDSNKLEYIQSVVHWNLVGCRQMQLDALKKGFNFLQTTSSHLDILSPTDLMMLMCGHRHIDADLLLSNITFIGFSDGQTRSFFVDFLKSQNEVALRLFLRLTTGRCTIPMDGSFAKIVVMRTDDITKFPVGHTCSSQLDLPDYDNLEILTQRMLVALGNVDEGGFTLR